LRSAARALYYLSLLGFSALNVRAHATYDVLIRGREIRLVLVGASGQGTNDDLKLMGRLEFGSGAVAMRYEPRR